MALRSLAVVGDDNNRTDKNTGPAPDKQQILFALRVLEKAQHDMRQLIGATHANNKIYNNADEFLPASKEKIRARKSKSAGSYRTKAKLHLEEPEVPASTRQDEPSNRKSSSSGKYLLTEKIEAEVLDPPRSSGLSSNGTTVPESLKRVTPFQRKRQIKQAYSRKKYQPAKITSPKRATSSGVRTRLRSPIRKHAAASAPRHSRKERTPSPIRQPPRVKSRGQIRSSTTGSASSSPKNASFYTKPASQQTARQGVPAQPKLFSKRKIKRTVRRESKNAAAKQAKQAKQSQVSTSEDQRAKHMARMGALRREIDREEVRVSKLCIWHIYITCIMTHVYMYYSL